MATSDYVFEICANGVESALAAQEAGAHRVELCASIPEGGTTPSYGEIRQARRLLTSTRLHLLIRPRGGDFVYSPLEAERMLTDIETARTLGVDGVVFGALTPDGAIDEALCVRLLAASHGMSTTFHRAFDCCRDPRRALETLIRLGFDRILTSGQQPAAEAGIPLLRTLREQAAGRITLLAGCGVNEENIDRIRRETGIREFHFSAREPLASADRSGHPLTPSFGNRMITTAKRVRETMKKLALLLLLLLPALPLAAQPLISDPAYRAEVLRAFDAKRAWVGDAFVGAVDTLADPAEAEALRFLYAYMPLADITDYPADFHLRNIRAAFRARAEMPWGAEVPELLFRHFVLPVRVNNEPLDDSRTQFFGELRERIAGLGMQEAILEVNHWCHERVTYAPSDARTLSPLACVRNALGRCGEESTFTVAALRAVGIPARQVYTPRWAHTDDNHAWVEAWADGRWYFLGACEPEPVLNLGWFNAPASRALLMHTRAFGDYRGPEEVMLRTGNFTEINLIDNYGSSDRIDFRVVDAQGAPVAGARVEFKIYNYAEFCTVATKFTDAEGRTFLTAGRGDLLVWASKEGCCGCVQASFGRQRELTIRLAPPRDGEVRELDIVPPAERVLIPEVPAALRAANQLRLAAEDSLRRAYEATFFAPDSAVKASPLLVRSRGNWPTISAFIDRYADREERVYALLELLSEKDLRDMPMEILEDHLLAASSQLCPRVEDEMIIRPYKQRLQEAFDAATRARMQADPALLVQWVREQIRLAPGGEALRIAQTPAGVWEARVTDLRSRDIFFVALARSLDIEARKDAVTGKVQYRLPGASWIDVDFEAAEQRAAPQGRLVLTYEPTRLLDDPKYYNHFTLTRIAPDGSTALLNFEEGELDMGGGTSWSNTFRDGAPLDAGTYLLTTGTRLANGSVLAANRIFAIRDGETTTLPLVLRQSETEVSVIGSFDSESRYLPFADGRAAERAESVLANTGRGYFVVGLVGIGQEPTDHALRDIARVRADFDAWERPVLLLFVSEAEAQQWRAETYGALPRNLLLGIDPDGAIRRQIAAQMKLQPNGPLPVFLIADTFNRVVFCSEGYTIGLGEQLQRVIKKL